MPLRDILLALLVVFIWGTSFIGMRYGVEEVPPLMLTAARFFFSAIPAIFLLPRPGASPKAVVGYGVALGIGMFGSVTTAVYLGMPIGLTSIVAQTQVFFTMLISFVLYGERPTRLQIIGAGLAAIGMVIFAKDRAASAPLGPFLLVVLGAFFWGVANIIGKRTQPDSMPAFIAWSSLVSPVPLVLASLWFDGAAAVAQSFHWPSLKLLLSVAYVAFIATNVGFALWGVLLGRHPVNNITPFALLIPIVGMASGVILFSEKITLGILIGSAVVMVGLALSVFGDRLVARFRH